MQRIRFSSGCKCELSSPVQNGPNLTENLLSLIGNWYFPCKNDDTILILDWQYIHLGKGVSDLVFLLVESVDFDEKLCDTLKYLYYKLYSEKYPKYEYHQYEKEFNLSLCMFPFFVCVWFNSEDLDKLIDSTFPLRFLRNIEKYYKYYLADFNLWKIY